VKAVMVRSKCLATVEHADCGGGAQLRLRTTAAAITAKSRSVAASSSSGYDAEVHKM
jgi:hypothetical protein